MSFGPKCLSGRKVLWAEMSRAETSFGPNHSRPKSPLGRNGWAEMSWAEMSFGPKCESAVKLIMLLVTTHEDRLVTFCHFGDFLPLWRFWWLFFQFVLSILTVTFFNWSSCLGGERF